MKGFFSKDSVLKVISLIVAILLWVYIIIVVDPSVDITVRDIPIKYVNQNALSDQGLCLINNGKAMVELKVRGSRKKIANIDNRNIYATVDLSNISKPGTFSLPISISIPYEYSEIVSKKPYNADVIIDRVTERTATVDVVASGSVANGYIAGAVTLNIGDVTLRGAAGVLDEIGGIAVNLKYGERNADISDTEKLYFTDRSGNVIESDSEIYSMVKVYTEGTEISEVEVSCPVYKLKTVPVKAVYAEGEDAANGYKVSIQPSNLTIYAAAKDLESITEIETVPINAAELNENGSVTAAVSVPENISLRDGITEVTVKAVQN